MSRRRNHFITAVPPLPKPRKCPTCNGRGTIPSRDRRQGEMTCGTCGGYGEI